ncbi:MAG: hypothetical protein JW904_12400 [Spirochaetales bacterium]|nr:hypothetical protein [Spirochaetales bacterium]
MANGKNIKGEETLLEQHVSSPFSFVVCLICVICAVFQADLFFKVFQASTALLCVLISKRQKKMFSIVILFAGTVASHLIFNNSAQTPLMSIAGFPVRKDSLDIGLTRAFTFITLVFYSKAFIRPDLNFPGKWGRLVSRSFSFLYLFLNEKIFVRKDFFGNLDAILTKVSLVKIAENSTKKSKTTFWGWGGMSLLLAFQCIFLILEIM